MISFLSLNHFTGAYEDVPYTDSHHTFELSCMFTFMIQMLWINTFIGKIGVGNVVMQNPHMYFATTLMCYLGLFRATIGAAIASFGYFYAYEFLYTYVPGFKIRDPSPNGWKKAYEEGQTTYLARLGACTFPALGYIFWAGRLKRSGMAFIAPALASMQYEYARSNVMPGNRLFYNVQSEKYLSREATFGSLAGDLRRKNDQDTGKNASVAQFRYVRLTTGLLQDTIWENATHENLPGSSLSYKVNNPYYNWQKAAQAYNAEAIKVKNDLWSLPSVLNARNMSGVLDAR
jgi:hypothetical protein